MELRHLRYFVAVAEEGSVTRAAERLHLQQPPLSQQIRALEAELGVRLFDRVARRMVVNAAGRQFLDDARRTLDSAAEAVTRVRRLDRGEQGHVAAGFTSSASLHRLAPVLIRAFRRAFPLATLDVEERETSALLRAVDERRLDLAFVRTTAAGFPALASHVLQEEAIVAALPADHPLARKPGPLRLATLMREPLVIYRRPDGPGIFDGIMHALHRRGLAPPVAAEVSRVLAAINLVAAGEGVSLVPASLTGLHAEAVAYRPLAGRSLPALPYTVVVQRRGVSALVGNCVDVLRRAAT